MNNQNFVQLAKDLSEIAEDLEVMASVIKDPKLLALNSSTLKRFVAELNKIALNLVFEFGLKEVEEV